MSNSFRELAHKRWRKNLEQKETLFNKTSNAKEQKKMKL